MWTFWELEHVSSVELSRLTAHVVDSLVTMATLTRAGSDVTFGVDVTAYVTSDTRAP